jgi:hypothetical protein
VRRAALVLALGTGTLALASCASTSETARTVTTTETVATTQVATVTETQPPDTVTVTVTETVSESAGGEATASGFPAGFPKEVPLSDVPEQMRLELGEEEGVRTAIALAPGVWTRNNPGTTVREDAEYGAEASVVGWCSSVKKFTKKYGYSPGSSCW